MVGDQRIDIARKLTAVVERENPKPKAGTTIWSISDLHLSFARPDRRERYAARWRDHATKIEREWRATVGPADVVLMPGDLSMARDHRDAQVDLEWLHRLPGTKVISAGNHDRWWNETDAIRPFLRKSQLAVGGDAVAVRGIIVCGTMGFPVASERSTEADAILSARETAALERALSQARELNAREPGPIYVLWHYPPFDRHRQPGPCVGMLERAGVTGCVYGHLHIEGQWSVAVQGRVRGIGYHCVAADAVGFRPLKIAGPGELERRWTGRSGV
jgi:predicted phosphohydrolase